MKTFLKNRKYVSWKHRNYLTLEVVKNLIVLAIILIWWAASIQ